MSIGPDTRAGLLAVLTVAGLLTACAPDAGAPLGHPSSAPVHRADNGPLAAADEREVNGYTVTRIHYPTRRIGDPAQNVADLYLPTGTDTSDRLRVIVLVHGGSWKSAFDLTMMHPFAIDLVHRGFAVYNIEYRRVGSGGGWPTTFTDVADAVDHLVDLAHSDRRLDLATALVLGYSSGGQLAAWLGGRGRRAAVEIGGKPRFSPSRVVTVAGPLDMTYAAVHGNNRIVAVLGGTPTEVPDRYRAVDPMALINPRLPVVAIHGDRDRLVPVDLSARYIDAVHRAGGAGQLVVAPGANHGSVAQPGTAAYVQILDIVTRFSRKSLEEVRTHWPR